MNALVDRLEEVLGRLQKIESAIEIIADQKIVKEWYTTAEVAQLLGRAKFTVREWCRCGRIEAAKRDCGRGNSTEWVIAHEELNRIRNHGLLPVNECSLPAKVPQPSRGQFGGVQV